MQFSRALILGTVNNQERTVEASLSSEQPVFRQGMGDEVLVHTPDAVDLSRAPLPLITAHDHQTTPIGIVEGMRIVGRKLRGILRFGNSQRASELWADVQAGIVRNLSVGYQILDYVQDGKEFRVTRWQPYECSIVAVPADATIGIGREFQKETIMNTNTEENMEQLTRSQRRGDNRAIEFERERVSDIIAIGEAQARFGADKLASQYVRDGRSVADFRSAVMELMSRKNEETYTVDLSNPSYGYGQRDLQNYSLLRAVNAVITGDWSNAGLEREINQESARMSGRSARGFFVPVGAMSSRALNTGSIATGGALVPTEHLGFVEMLRPHARVLELGATVLPGLTGSVELPKQTSSSTAEWIAEDDALTGSSPSFDSILMNPKTVGAMTSWTRRMMLQSLPGVEDIVRRDLASAIGLAIDSAALHGTGNANQPTGIYAATNVNSVAMGGVPTFGKMIDMVGEVAKDNGLAGSLGFITTPGLAAKLSQTVVAASTDTRMIWSGSMSEGELAGYRAYATNQVLSTLGAGAEHGVVFGNWAELIIGQWGGAIDILVDPYTYADRGRVRITAFTDLDIAIRHPESFCKATGATTL